ncbi:MAG: hypothetical protein M3317_01135 [Actinomycetota bacterium]|nr:hypothetical protein [Actinomycetota bacterium]
MGQEDRPGWQLACCAFSFCWWAYGRLPTEEEGSSERAEGDLPVEAAGRGKEEASGVLAAGVEAVRGWLQP